MRLNRTVRDKSKVQSEFKTSSPKCRRHVCSARRHNLLTSRILAALRSSKYVTALRHFLSLSSAARRAFDVVVSELIRQQVAAFVRSSKQVFSGVKSVEEFCWAEAVGTMSNELPTLYAALSASMPRKLLDDDEQLTCVGLLSVAYLACQKGTITFHLVFPLPRSSLSLPLLFPPYPPSPPFRILSSLLFPSPLK